MIENNSNLEMGKISLATKSSINYSSISYFAEDENETNYIIKYPFSNFL